MNKPLRAVFSKHPTVSDLDLVLNIVKEAHEQAAKANQICRADFHVTITQDEEGLVHTTIGFTHASDPAIITAAYALNQLSNKIELVEGGVVPKEEYFWGYEGPTKEPKKDTDK